MQGEETRFCNYTDADSKENLNKGHDTISCSLFHLLLFLLPPIAGRGRRRQTAIVVELERKKASFFISLFVCIFSSFSSSALEPLIARKSE